MPDGTRDEDEKRKGKAQPSAYTPSRFPWLRPFVSIVLVLALGLTAYFLLYASQRVEKRVHLAYDELSSVGEDIDARSDRYAKSLENRKIDGLCAGQLCRPDLQFFQDLGLEAKIQAPDKASGCGPGRVSIDRAGLTVAVTKTIPGGGQKCLVATRPIRKLLGGASATSIDGVLIADSNGGVLGADEQLPSMLALDASLVSLGGAGARKTPADGSDASSTPLAFDPLGLDDLPRTSVAGGDYLVLCVPLRLGTLSDDRHEPRLCGLVQEAELRRHALSLSPVASTWLIALVAALLLALPYLKVRFMSPRERLRASDMWMLAASAIALTGGGVVIVVFAYATHRFERTMDSNLTDFVATLRRNFDAEISAAHGQLNAAAPELMKEPKGTNPGRVLEAGRAKLLSSYPFFEAITLTDTTRQVSKWMPRQLPSSLISLEDQRWLKRTLNLTSPPAFSFDQTFAATTGPKGENQVGAELPLSRRTGAAAIAIEMMSMAYAVDPFPFGHAMVTPEKKVAFRSDLSPRRLVPFSSEWERGAALLARAGSESPTEPADLRYRGRMYRVTAIRSHQVADVTLVGFYDKAAMESAVTESLRAPLLMIALVAIGMLGAGLLSQLAGSAARDWFWPQRERGTIYLACAIWLLAVAAGLLFAAAHGFSGLLYALLGWPPTVIAAMSIACAFETSRDGLSSLVARVPRSTPLYPTSYVIFGVAVLASTVAVPVAIVAWDSVQAQHEAFQARMVAEGQERFGDWTRRIEERWIETGNEPAGRARTGQILIKGTPGILAEARAYGDHLPERFPRAPTAASDPTIPPCRDVLSPLPEVRRFSLVLSACWEALGGPASAQMAHLAAIAEPGWRSGIAGGESMPVDWLRLAAGCAILFGAAWWFVRSLGRQILGLELEGDGVVDRAQVLLDHKDRGPCLLLRPSRDQLREVRKALSIEEDKDVVLGRPDVTREHIDREGPLLVTGVERVLSNRDWSKALRDRLASPRKGPLVLVSEIDPLYFFLGRARESSSPDAPFMSEEEKAWAPVMKGVERIRFALPPTGKRRKGSVRRRIHEECQWTDRLRDIEPDVQTLAHGKLDWNQTVDLILDLVEPSYREQWNLCSTEERRVLRQLAEEGVVNPRCFDILSRLRRRRLIRSDPRFRIVNESFRRFILEAESEATVRAWERPEGGRGSLRVRGPLLVFGVLALVLLLATEGKDTFAAFTAVAGAIPLIRNLTTAARSIDPVA
jgi:hypothetical protein